ncbi:UNVERIFIED_CONTAM: Increased DNA methylation 1 [Sesamum radiatum]|uniref:Increased DNA methylation 1 n=1 Tax=Sesamum radiatum TaxID=300843 RepID=A0AAW2K8Z1_SESRA
MECLCISYPELSKNHKSSTKENDDLCSICEDGGDLLCCKNCPRAFHTECVGLSVIPQGIWYCKYCRNMFEREKLAEPDANAIAAGRVPGVDPLEAITQRCIRTVETFEPDIGGCAICSDENLVIQCVASLASINSKPNLFLPFSLSSLLSGSAFGNSVDICFFRRHDFCKSKFAARTIILCDQCEKEYHVGCLKEKNIDDLKMKCKGQDLQKNPELEIRWRLLRGKKATEDTRVWLSGAVNIFHDRFDPIVDASTGRLDLIPHMVYGSVVVSAGIFRIFGEEVAELPLVATRSECQGKGYFQSLFYCIEGLLASLNVKDLILPAAHEAESLWKNKFGFEKLGQEQNDKLV